MPKFVEDAGKKEAVKKANPPRIRTKSAGKVNQRLDLLARAYKDNNEGMDCRWVWAPQNKPDLSNILDRQIDGYRIVKVSELGLSIEEAMPGLKADDAVRVGDVVLMGIDAATRKGYMDENLQKAQDELKRVDRQFHEELEKLNRDLKEEHRSRPRGSMLIEQVEKEVNMDEAYKA